ncbi:hypothetical protein F383_34365 [Gossypium arboreum]|uniref:Uncharacterized protein n=1 Tax=Gossypium arboreum TaxID=29729 RepID=A0A0B0MYQ5_GOSAR|nr:hypothetical protein F383_34365 [Gossypium arboreum]
MALIHGRVSPGAGT